MNTSNLDIDYKFLLEIDNNPIIVFNHDGKILYLNNNAEILMSYANVKDIFNLALKHAPKEYGSQTVQIELSYNQLKFYAINVSYNSDEWIAIRFYYRPRESLGFKRDKNSGILTNINKLLDIAIIQFKIESNTDIRIFTDQDIPQTLINQNSFLKLLRKTLSLFKASPYLDITLKLGIGEHIIIDHKRYMLINLEFKSNSRYCLDDENIKKLAEELYLVANLSENCVCFEIPLIKD